MHNERVVGSGQRCSMSYEAEAPMLKMRAPSKRYRSRMRVWQNGSPRPSTLQAALCADPAQWKFVGGWRRPAVFWQVCASPSGPPDGGLLWKANQPLASCTGPRRLAPIAPRAPRGWRRRAVFWHVCIPQRDRRAGGAYVLRLFVRMYATGRSSHTSAQDGTRKPP